MFSQPMLQPASHIVSVCHHAKTSMCTLQYEQQIKQDLAGVHVRCYEINVVNRASLREKHSRVQWSELGVRGWVGWRGGREGE
jgi:hypothetical protein